MKPAAAAAPATLPNRSAPTLRASFEPTLRASFDETPVPAVEIPDSGAEAIAAETHEEEASAHEYLAQALQAGERINFARPPRRGSWYLKVAGLTAVSLLMVGGAVAMKVGGMPGLHKSPPLILAADGPSKIAPPNEATVQSAGDTGALLLKDSAAPTPAPVKLVSTEEQPVDLLAQTPAPAPKPPAADGQSAPAPKPPAADAQPAPAPNSPAADGQLAPAPNTPIVAPSEGLGGAPAPGRTLFPSAKRVKTVSVRPDGTLISSDTAPDAPVAQSPAPAPSPAPVAPARKPENAGAAALAATPTIELPAKPEPKSSARVNVAKTETPAPADSSERAAAARLGRACRQAGQDAQAEARRRRGRDAGRRRNRNDAEIRNGAGGRRMGGSARGSALRVRGAGHPLPVAEQIQRGSGLGLARRAQGRSQRRDRLSRPGRRPFQSRCAQLVLQAEGERRRLLRGEKQLTQGLRA